MVLVGIEADGSGVLGMLVGVGEVAHPTEMNSTKTAEYFRSILLLIKDNVRFYRIDAPESFNTAIVRRI